MRKRTSIPNQSYRGRLPPMDVAVATALACNASKSSGVYLHDSGWSSRSEKGGKEVVRAKRRETGLRKGWRHWRGRGEGESGREWEKGKEGGKY